MLFYFMYSAVKSSRATVAHIKLRAVKFTERRHVSGLRGMVYLCWLLQEASYLSFSYSAQSSFYSLVKPNAYLVSLLLYTVVKH